MSAKIYLEIMIVSYLTSRPSSELITAAHQKMTLDWWSNHRHRFQLYVSATVLNEASKGDPAAAARRMTVLAGVPILETTTDAKDLARVFIKRNSIPAKALDDALHVAVATVQGMDFLLTWNCRI